MNKHHMQGSVGVILLVVCFVAIIGMLGYIFLVQPQQSTTRSVPPNAQQVLPTIPVKDFDPTLPNSQKTSILIQTSDSSDEKYVVPTDQVDVYVKNLPPGDHVISKTIL